MPTQVDIPGIGIVEFPDGMTDDQISLAIKRDILKQEPTPVVAPQAAPEPPAEGFVARTTTALGDVPEAIARGYYGAKTGLNVLGLETGLLTPEEAAANIAASTEAAKQYAMPESVRKGMEEIQNAQGWKETGLALARNLDVIPSVLGESIPASATSIGTGLIGGLLGAVAGPVGATAGLSTGVGVGSAATEYASSLNQFLTSKGVNTSDPDQLKAAFSNPDLMSEARNDAATRGIAVGAFDALSAGIAGRLFAPVKGALGDKALGTVAGTGAEIISQAGAGAGGEAAAQLATEGKITSPGAVALEAVGEIVPGIAEAAISKATGARTTAESPIPPPSSLREQALVEFYKTPGATEVATEADRISTEQLAAQDKAYNDSLAAATPTAVVPPTTTEYGAAAVSTAVPTTEQPAATPIPQTTTEFGAATTPTAKEPAAPAVQSDSVKLANIYIDKLTEQNRPELVNKVRAIIATNDDTIINTGLSAVDTVYDMIKSGTLDPKFVSQGKITDSQGNEVAGGYMPSTQTIRLNNLDSTSAYFDPITTAAHEAVHHLDNLATGTDFARVSESIFSPIASKWQGGKDLLSLLPRSVKSQYGKAGLEYLENQLANIPEGEKNPYEVRAYLIGARTHDRMYGTTPKNRNFIGKVLDFGAEFVERFANKISGVGWTSAGDTLNAISSGKLSQGLMNLGIVANPQATAQKPPAAPPKPPAALADATAPTVEEAAVQPPVEEVIPPKPKGKKKSKAAPTVDENAPITEYDNEPYVSPYGLKPPAPPVVEPKTESDETRIAAAIDAGEYFSRASFAKDTKIPNSRNGEFFGKGITNEEAMSLTRRLGTGIKPGRIYLPEGDDTRGRAHIEKQGHIPELQDIGFNGIVDALEYVTSKRENNDFNIGGGTSYVISAIKKVNGKDVKIFAAIAPDLNDTSKHSVITLYPSTGKKPSERGATQVDRGTSERMKSLTPEQRRAMIMNKEQFSRAAAQTSANVEEFKSWWKRSKAVDTNGEPKRFYTGKATTRLDKDGKPFKSFTRAGSGVMLDAMGKPIPGMKGPFYFSPDAPFADQFAMRRLSQNDFKENKVNQANDGGRMIPVFLSVQNPFDFDNPEHVARIMQDQILKSDVLRGRIQKRLIEDGFWKEIEKTAVQGAIRRSGFDGFYLTETIPEYNDNNEPTGKEITSKNLAVYNPKQIKGVFNEFAPGTAESEQFSRARATGDQFSTDMKSRSDRKFGVYPYLRAFTNVLFDHKRKIMAGVNPNNAALQIQYLNELERNYPNPLVDAETFTTMASDAFGSAVVDSSVPLPPYNAIRMVQDPTIIEQQIGRMSPSQRQMAEDGFKLGKRVKAAYVNGKMTPSHTAKLVLWGILSRGVSPFIQESAFLDVVTERGNKAGIGYFIESALNGEFNKREYLDWSNMIMPESSPGNSTKHNLNGFGDSLMKLSETLPSGKTLLQELHDMIADYRLSGKEIRRRFHSINTGIGINNKVLSFVLLVSGRTDVVVLDRVQMRNLFNDGRFDSYNLYDGEKIPKMVKNQKTGKTALKDVQDVGTNMNKLGDDMVGLMYYEAIERGMKDAIKTAYNNLGRGDGSPGQFHWESWVATSAQEVDHGSIEGILRDALGVVDPYYNINTRQGKYDEFSSGMIYGYDKNAAPYVDLPDGLGNFFRFTPSDGKEVLDQVKKPANGIVPENFKVSQNVEGPWYNNKQVNKAKLNQLYSERGTLVYGDNAGLGKADTDVIGRRNTAAATASAVERAIARSGEQFSRAAAQTGENVEEFNTWGRNAIVSNDIGEPRRYYTGTSKDTIFKKFKVERHGAWFASDPETASMYAERNDSQGYKYDIERGFFEINTASRVIPAFLRAENPYTGDLPSEAKKDNYKKAQSDWFDSLRRQGYDAWIPESINGNLVVILKDPNQIKGAFNEFAPGTAKSEQFSRANQRQKDILKSMMAPPNNKGGIEKFASEVYVKDGSLGSGLGGLKVRFIQGLFDYLAPLKLIAPNAYKKFRIANNSASIALSVIANGPIERFKGGYRTIPGAKSLTAIIDGIGKKYGPEGVHLWTGYMAAKRSKRLILEGRESLMTQADIDEMLDLINQYPEFETARKEWIEFNDKNVDFARANGTLTAREAASWKANGDYIPFYRALDDDGGLVAPGVGTLARQSDVSKKLKGSDKQLGNILENMILNTDLLVRKAIRNDALRSLEREAAGTGALQKISGVTPTSVLTTGKSIADEIADHLSKVMGIDRTDPAFDVIVQPIIDATDMSDAGLISLFGFKPNMDKDVMVVRGPSGIAGDTSTKRYYKIKDPLLVTALTFVPPSNLGFMRLLTAPKTLFTRAITMAPPFMAANLFRDTLQARVLSNAKTIPFFDTTKGLYASLRNTQGAKDLQAGGGSTTNNYDSSSLNRYKKLTGSKSNPFMVALGNAWGALEAIGNATEVANRIAIREAKLKSGASLGDANFEALDIMDFSLRGSNAIVNFMISTVPFLNARLQGMYKLGRAGFSKENRANFMLMGSMFALASLGLAAMNEDDERYKKETNVSKDNYIHIYLDKILPKEALIAAGIDKWTEDFHIALPKPFEIGAVFMTIPERMYGVYNGTQQAKDLRDSVWGIVGTTFKMHPVEMIPYPAKIAAEQIMNVDLFRKQDIVPDYKRAPGFEEAEYKYDTPEILKAFSQAVKDSTGVGISPLRAEKLIRDFAGTFGEYFMMAGDMAYREMNGMPQPINKSLLESVTGQSRFVKTNSPAYTQHEQDFYNLSKDIKSIVRVLDTFDKENPEKAEKFEEANAAYLSMEKKANKVSKQLADLRSAKEQIYREGGPNAEAEIKAINAEENELTRDFMIEFREVEKEY